jgi:hypothetical protein
MSRTLEFYLARADDAAHEAKAAMLDNVRDRALRAEAAWRHMADRQVKIETGRDAADEVRRARDEVDEDVLDQDD